MPPITVTIPRPPITTLVLRGDGIKGVGYVGALQALNEKNLIQELATVAGSSAGAVTAMLIALGYTQKEIEHELRGYDH